MRPEEPGGIGEGSYDGWVLEQYEVSLPKSRKAILSSISEILKAKRIQQVVLEMGKPIIFKKWVKGEESKEPGEVTIGQIARNVNMEELDDISSSNPKPSFYVHSAEIVRVLLAISARNMFLTHVGLSPDSEFFNWLAVDKSAYGGITNFGGALLLEDVDIPPDAALFCASYHRGGNIEQIGLVIKLSLFNSEE
jgi:hypothetical protein